MYIIIVNYRLKIETLIANVIITYSYVQQHNIKTYYKVGVYDGKKYQTSNYHKSLLCYLNHVVEIYASLCKI